MLVFFAFFTVWFSQEGYHHQHVGRKVSRIQAVLARRCAAIGELQEQILTAGWTKGVAQWGVVSPEFGSVHNHLSVSIRKNAAFRAF
jgi:hypothetical protein